MNKKVDDCLHEYATIHQNRFRASRAINDAMDVHVKFVGLIRREQWPEQVRSYDAG